MKRLTDEELTEDDFVVQFSLEDTPAEVARWVKIYAHKYAADSDGVVTAELSGYRWREIEQLTKGLAT